jgi:hypothetical protein
MPPTVLGPAQATLTQGTQMKIPIVTPAIFSSLLSLLYHGHPPVEVEVATL